MGKRKEIKVGFEESSRMLPFIRIRIEGMDGEKLALVDSGSEITLLDKEIAESLKGKPSFVLHSSAELSLDGVGGQVNGKTYTFAAYVDVVDNSSEKRTFTITGNVSDFSGMRLPLRRVCNAADTVMIIGSDMLKKMRAKIDFKNGNLTFDDLSGHKKPGQDPGLDASH